MRSEPFEIRNSNGTLRGHLARPGAQPRAAVVCLHGGPGGNLHGNLDIFDEISVILAEIDIITIQFSMFGSTPSDGNPQDMCLRTQLVDYQSILGYVKSRFTCPIHVAGESLGATIAALSWNTAISSYALLWPAFDLRDTDLRAYITPVWESRIKQDGFINDNGLIIGYEFFQELLETDFSGCFKLPNIDILIAHGRADTEVPYDQSLKALANARKTTLFLANESAGHGFKSPEHRRIVLSAIKYWFQNR